MTARPFVLLRNEDVSGVSGTGIVAEGVEFSDGTVALRWLSADPTSVVFHDHGIESVRKIQGHDGKTDVIFTFSDGYAVLGERLEWRPQHEGEFVEFDTYSGGGH